MQGAMTSLTEVYDARVTEGRLRGDAAQRVILPVLEAVRQGLEAPPAKRGFFGRAKPVGVRGVYIWGGVGRGKSMLMDLFMEAVAIDAKRRVHFHAFMAEVHDLIGVARQSGDGDLIQPVARQIAAKARLLC